MSEDWLFVGGLGLQTVAVAEPGRRPKPASAAASYLPARVIRKENVPSDRVVVVATRVQLPSAACLRSVTVTPPFGGPIFPASRVDDVDVNVTFVRT